MYFVVECTTTSAPSASGFCSAGEAKVLSTTTRSPASWPTPARAAMSVIFISGLLGVSTHSALVVPGRTAARTASASAMSVTVISTPQAPSTRENSR